MHSEIFIFSLCSEHAVYFVI